MKIKWKSQWKVKALVFICTIAIGAFAANETYKGMVKIGLRFDVKQIVDIDNGTVMATVMIVIPSMFFLTVAVRRYRAIREYESPKIGRR